VQALLDDGRIKILWEAEYAISDCPDKDVRRRGHRSCWTAGRYDNSSVQRALVTIPPLQAERAAAASAVKEVKRTNAENTMDPAPTASKKRKMSTSVRATGELRLPQGASAKVEKADPALRSAFHRANKRLDSLRHVEETSSSRYRQALAERAAIYAKIDPEYAVASALQTLAPRPMTHGASVGGSRGWITTTPGPRECSANPWERCIFVATNTKESTDTPAATTASSSTQSHTNSSSRIRFVGL
jgi:hypothetical protein